MARLHRFGLGVLLLAASAALAAAAPPSAAVRYLSADQVYLDAGSAAGFAEGDTLKVLRKGQVSATLLVLHAAEHSASCRLLTGKAPVLGDRVQGVARGETAAPPPVAPAARRERTVPEPRRRGAAQGLAARLGGSVKLSWDGYRDDGAASRDYDRASLALGLRGEHLAGRDLRLDLRLRQRWIARDGASAADERRLRLYVAAVELGANTGRVHLALGRLGAGRMAESGALDGGLLGLRFRDVELGGYAGSMPDWADPSLATHGLRGGVYLRQTLEAARWSLEGVSERMDGEISREYLLSSGTWRGGDITLRQRTELDVNRGWRAERAGGQSLALSSLRLSGDWRPSGEFSAGLRFDPRETPLDAELRSLPDSLFEAARSSGTSASARWRPDRQATLSGRAGWRGREGQDRGTLSYGADVLLRPAFAPSLRGGLHLSGFDGPAAAGLSPSADLYRDFPAGHSLGLATGAYLYTPQDLERRSNRWVRVDGRLALPARSWLALELENDSGDDIRGLRFFAELGRRF
ncbi:MAG: hypothetical protein H6694_05240 [Candidatus Latescibacteria bacterium]|nr:hypothetical protein [Candidatus Latescibacterota bacterium]